MPGLLYEKESYAIRGACYDVYKELRNNHKEIVYHNALFNDLLSKMYKVEKNAQIPIFYHGKKVGVYVPDLTINGIIVVELKCKPRITKEDLNQFWYYLRNTPYQIGFLVNFGAEGGIQICRRIHTNKLTQNV